MLFLFRASSTQKRDVIFHLQASGDEGQRKMAAATLETKLALQEKTQAISERDQAFAALAAMRIRADR
jgi:hypothetical protein